MISKQIAGLQNPSSSSSLPVAEPLSNSGNDTTPLLVNDANLSGPLLPPHEAGSNGTPQNLESLPAPEETLHQPG